MHQKKNFFSVLFLLIKLSKPYHFILLTNLPNSIQHVRLPIVVSVSTNTKVNLLRVSILLICLCNSEDGVWRALLYVRPNGCESIETRSGMTFMKSFYYWRWAKREHASRRMWWWKELKTQVNFWVRQINIDNSLYYWLAWKVRFARNILWILISLCGVSSSSCIAMLVFRKRVNMLLILMSKPYSLCRSKGIIIIFNHVKCNNVVFWEIKFSPVYE